MIDDMLKNQVPKKTKGKALKVFVFFIIFLLILLAVAVGVLFFLKSQKKVSPKDEFVSYLGKGNISNVLNFEKVNNLSTRINNEQSESSTEITADIPGLPSSEIDLNDLKIEFASKSDPELDKKTSDVSIKYKDNEVLNFNLLTNGNKIGLFSEDILTKYIGSKFSNLDEVLGRALNQEEPTIIDAIDIDFEQLRNMNFVFPQFSNEMLSKYIDIIKQKIVETAFSSKQITLEKSSGKVDVTEYTMSLNEGQAIELLDQVLQTLENDDELLDSLLSSVIENEKQRDSIKESFKGIIENFINSLYEKTPDNSKIYSLKVYGSNDVTHKVTLDLAGFASVDIDYEYGENENKMTINFLENSNQSGVSVDIIRTTSDFSEKLDFTINKIENSDIVSKINFVSDLKNSGDSYTLKNTVDCNLSIFSFNFQVSSEIDFKQVEIDKLTDENCVYLDEQDTEVFDTVINDVRNRTEEVITDNLVEQGIIPEPEEPEIEGGETGENPSTSADDKTLKEEARNKLVSSISEAMSIAQSEGRDYTLDDLINLEIPDSSFTVSVDGDEAILNIDGFEFRLNSSFELYE